jgi:hypothetical protein
MSEYYCGWTIAKTELEQCLNQEHKNGLIKQCRAYAIHDMRLKNKQFNSQFERAANIRFDDSVFSENDNVITYKTIITIEELSAPPVPYDYKPHVDSEVDSGANGKAELCDDTDGKKRDE